MSDHIERAAEVVDAHVGSPAHGGTAGGAWVDCRCGVIVDGVSRDHATGKHRVHAARALDAAGLLATPAHDAAVAAKALREAAEALVECTEYGGEVPSHGDPERHVGPEGWLRERADRIEAGHE